MPDTKNYDPPTRREPRARGAELLVLILFLIGVTAAAVTLTRNIPESYCSPQAQDARHADIMFERAEQEPPTRTDRACQR